MQSHNDAPPPLPDSSHEPNPWAQPPGGIQVSGPAQPPPRTPPAFIIAALVSILGLGATFFVILAATSADAPPPEPVPVQSNQP